MKTPKHLYFYPFILLLLFCSNSFGQQKWLSITLKDAHSDEPVIFASVIFNHAGIGKLTDSSGTFRFSASKWPADSVTISCVGYQTIAIGIDVNKDSIVLALSMEPGKFIEGAVVKATVNKGLFVWKKIVQHKPDNDRYRFSNFSYELYNKLELDIKNINVNKIVKLKPLRAAGELIKGNIDSAEGIKYLPTYLTETISDYYYQKKPLKRREVIKASNTNGINNESIVKYLGGMDQNVNVYNNFITIFNLQFVSPASDNGDLYYNYKVIDTQLINNQRYFHLVFAPRRAGTNTFEGDCWVHVGSFAIQKMNLRLGKMANVNYVDKLSLIQEFTLINDSTWFLLKDKFVADISPPIAKKIPGFIGRKTTTYRNVLVNDSSVTAELNHNKIMEEVVTLPDAVNKNKEYWAESRHEELSKTEAGILKMIDTLLNDPKFKRLTDRINFFATGYKDIGNVRIGQWYNWITANSWEGFRVRFDISSNKKFDKKLWYHTYLAYGFGDKKLKGKGELFYLPNKHPRRYWYLSYTNDLDFGQTYYGEVTQDNIFALAIRKPDIPLKFIRIEEKRFEFFNEHRFGLSELLAITHKNFDPLQNLPPRDSFPALPGRKNLVNAEVSLRLRFAYLEKFLENTFFRTSLGSPYPIGELYIAQGITGVFKSNYTYTKLSGSISDYMKIPPFGSFSYQVYAGKTFGKLPYVLLDVAPGNELHYYNKYTFNMMNRYEFIHDRYAGINLEHNIGNGIFRLFPKLKFRQLWTLKTLWGNLSQKNKDFNFNKGGLFQSLNGKTYLELGTGVDNILHVFRIDFVWRLLPTSIPDKQTKKFGIFGSFRLAF